MVLDKKSLLEYPDMAGVPQVFIQLLFLICFNDLPENFIGKVAIYVNDNTLLMS